MSTSCRRFVIKCNSTVIGIFNLYRVFLNERVRCALQAGAQGVCNTLYAITEDEKADRILLTKTRDLNNCQEKIVKDLGLAYTEKCIECQKVTQALFELSAMFYTL